MKFHSQPIYDEKYEKTFNDVINIVFSDSKTPNENNP